MDIIIKSFNRAYYLDRCLYSIYKNVKGDYHVTIIDDGTPNKYLDKIKSKYPGVVIKKTALSEKKSEALTSKINRKIIKVQGYPTKDWIKTVAESKSNYILVTEDDVWFTREINLDKILSDIVKFDIQLTKIGWQGMSFEKLCSEFDISENIKRQIPIKIITFSKKNIHRIFFNKWKIRSILYRFGVIDQDIFKKYYLLLSISMGIHKKQYWLDVWHKIEGNYMELNQLSNAASIYNKNMVIGRTKDEYLKTSYISSATMSDHSTKNAFDIDFFNHIINEEWYNDNFDILNNYPNDFEKNYIGEILAKHNCKYALRDDWELWADNFKAHFRNMGASVD